MITVNGDEMLQDLSPCDWDPLRMPSVSSLRDAASSWIKIREDARAELRLSDQVKGRHDKETIVSDLACVGHQLRASQRTVGPKLFNDIVYCTCRLTTTA